jgi:L-iditol 2-dehydrogenase
MKVGVLAGPGRVALEERAEPRLGPEEVRVELAACGVCGTDLEKLRGNYRSAGILGHEPVGSVVEVGSDVSAVARGSRVFVHHHVPCYACDVCRSGAYTFCPTYSKTNLDPGGFAERFRVPEANVRRGAILPLDGSVSWEVGALLEPAGCALTAIRTVGLSHGARILVLGLGPVGLLYARLARALGAGWIGGTDFSPLRRSAAERGGVDWTGEPRAAEDLREATDRATGGEGVDLAVVATAAPAAVAAACRLVRRSGTVNLFGLPEPGSRLDFDLQELYLKGVRIVPTYATTERDLRAVHTLLLGHRLALDDLVTHRVPLDRIAEAFATAAEPEKALKVVVTGPAFGP